VLWCWRCKQDVPMLDEGQYAEVHRLYGECMNATKELREKWGLPLGVIGVEERMLPVTLWYEQKTGMAGCYHNAVMHHRLSLYGKPCASCGKPLRTPKAKFCAACGAGSE